MKKNMRSYLVMGLTIGALTVGGSISAYASSSNTNTQQVKAMGQGLQRARGKNHGFGKMDFGNLVSNGTIDQETADKISAYMESQTTTHQAVIEKVKNISFEERKAYIESNKTEQKADPFSEMVSAGVMTQEQADAIQAVIPQQQKNSERKNQGGKIDFSNLISNGTIDQETADKISAYMESQTITRQAETEKVKSMTDDERKAYMESNKTEQKADLFSEMVSAGVMTQEQADAIKAVTPQQQMGGERKNQGGKMDFSNLISDGIIDQETADKISDYMESQTANRQAEMEKIESMTVEERKTYFEK